MPSLPLDPSPRPSSITGGYLCTLICFTISFPLDTPWPPEVTHFTHSLPQRHMQLIQTPVSYVPMHHVPKVDFIYYCSIHRSSVLPLTPALASFPQNFPIYSEYESSMRRFRGFCSRCGSSLFWRSVDRTDTFDLFLGTVDEKWLVENKEIGTVLGTPNQYQFWCENAMKGVTDVIRGGRKFLQEDDGSGAGELLG